MTTNQRHGISCRFRTRLAAGTMACALAAVAARAASDPGDDQPWSLPMNSIARHPPTAEPIPYATTSEELLINPRLETDRPGWDASKAPIEGDTGARERRSRGQLIQKLAAGALKAGRAYTLTVRLKDGSVPPLEAGVRFREPRSGSTYRTYTAQPSGPQTQTVDFTAPAYVEQAEVWLAGNGHPSQVVEVSLRMRPPIAATQPVDDWSASYTPPGYQLVFNDEFNGKTLDRRKWFTRYISGGETLDRLNDENQRYTDNETHQVEGGVLKLVARRKPFGDVKGMNYESGMIRSDWTLRYGFLEARVRMPSGRGVWSAFWLNSDVGPQGRINWPPEIDIFEYVYNEFDDKANKLHLAANTPKGTQPIWLFTHRNFKRTVQNWVAPYDFDKGWHTVGLEWKPGAISFFVDGEKVMSRRHDWTYADGTEAASAHILLNLAIGGAWAGRHGIDDRAFPQSFDIDWVRAYQRPGH